MNNLDGIRRLNLFALMEEAGGSVTSLAKKTGIHRPALSALLNGKVISDGYARKLDQAFEKPFGWLSTDHEIEGTPAYNVEIVERVFGCIYGMKRLKDLYEELEVAGKADLFSKIYALYTDPEVRDLPLSTFYKMFTGGINETTKSGKDIAAKGDSKP